MLQKFYKEKIDKVILRQALRSQLFIILNYQILPKTVGQISSLFEN